MHPGPAHDAPLTSFQQNMALVPFPLRHARTGRRAAIAALVAYLLDARPDFAAISELWVRRERDTVRNGLRAVYPFCVAGPDRNGLARGSGLLFLSRHPIAESHRTVYRNCAGEDCFANKGALHAVVEVAGHPTPYDFFFTHLQSADPVVPLRAAAAAALARQLAHLGAFVRAFRHPQRPALLMGDLNADASRYHTLVRTLGPFDDLWLTAGDGSSGITMDDACSFRRRTPARSIGDPARHRKPHPENGNKRIDYALSWPGTRFVPVHRDTGVLVLQSSPGQDISDHYGVECRQIALVERTAPERPLAGVRVAFTGFHCLGNAGRAGLDHVSFLMNCKSANGGDGSRKTAAVGPVRCGTVYSFPAPAAVEFGDPGNWLSVRIGGSMSAGPLGVQAIALDRFDLLAACGSTVERTLPFLTGSGAEYAVSVNVTVW